MLYNPKVSGQAKTFRRSMPVHLQGISPSAGDTPWFFFLAKNACMFLSVSVLLSALVERLGVSHFQDFFILYLRWKLVIFYSYVSISKITMLAFVHIKKNTHLRQSCDKIHCILLILTFAITSTDQPPTTLYLWHNNLLLSNCHKFYSKSY